MIFISPESAPQVFVPALGSVRHPLAGKVMALMGQLGPRPIGLWKVVNKLSSAERPDYRARHRCWRLRFWGACRGLLNAKLLYRHGPLIALKDFAIRSRPKPERLPPSARKTSYKKAGSKAGEQAAENGANLNQPVGTKLVNGNNGPITSPSKTQSVVPSSRAISAAAGLLAMRQRRRKRKWTGIWDGERIRRGTAVKLPNGTVRPVFAIRRGKVFVFAPEGSGRFLDRFDASEVSQIKNPAAVVMGLLKRGRREKPSRRKKEAARRNGCMPPRAGRFRGRPKKFTLP